MEVCGLGLETISRRATRSLLGLRPVHLLGSRLNLGVFSSSSILVSFTLCHIEIFEQIKMDGWMDGWMDGLFLVPRTISSRAHHR